MHTLPVQKNCCNPHLLSEGVSRCCLMWFLRGGSCTKLVRRNQLLHRCTNGPFTGHINQGAPGLGHCPESTVQRESHLTPVHWLKGTSIITVQHSVCHLLFSFPPPPPCVHSPSAVSALFSICISMVPLFSSFSSSPPPLPLLCYALHTFQPNRLPSGCCDLRRNVISSPAIGCAPFKSVLTVSYYIVYLPEGRCSCTLTTFKSVQSGATTGPCLASLICSDMWSIMSTVIPVRIGLRTRSRWRKLSQMLRCLRQEINSLALKYHKLVPSDSIPG